MSGIVELTTMDGLRLALSAKMILGVTASSRNVGSLVSVAQGSYVKDIVVKEGYEVVLRSWKAALAKRPRPSALE
jgi:hypothetical protein